MMQLCECRSQRQSLMIAVNRFIDATKNMDETVMVPSLLRDVPLQEEGEEPQQGAAKSSCFSGSRDMYECYQLLKSIKTHMEWGFHKLEDRDGAGGDWQEGEGEELDGDLETQFRYHLKGLFCVLNKLTVQADHLTNRYKREIGCGT
ncbi:mid1-interacting protein 1-like [Latimeria chalumnae]|uniref:mid1-interacting protein 1-like n=1 Tax=Latimeria chalumnae TaxID=7897 RepID=UPI0003C1332A|nr:PREDICTED: mid1-interacting protein 1-like [Latimeria chalumnae]XP_005992046.1 PREDICTED: mid1-interacting protein 1-like [Latimeria chalumnae]|eukprot:XP_005992045.1 PREDICTED: mid1-interacting protein 1-like [Latimeria chalumnae]